MLKLHERKNNLKIKFTCKQYKIMSFDIKILIKLDLLHMSGNVIKTNQIPTLKVINNVIISETLYN